MFNKTNFTRAIMSGIFMPKLKKASPASFTENP